jgi:uncharacterized membrane protein YfcA
LKQLVPAAILGSFVGCALLLGTPEKLFEWIAPALVLVAAVVMAAQDYLIKRLADPQDQPRWVKTAAVFGIGVYGGYFIAAIGVIIMAVLGLVLKDEIRRTVAMKNVIQLSIGAVAATTFALFGPVAQLQDSDPFL